LSGQISLDGKELDFVPNTDDPFGAALVDKMKGDDFVQKQIRLANKSMGDSDPDAQLWFEKYIDELERLKGKSISRNPGHLYKMNIPDETIDKMLDWDKPLFQQSDQVKRILDNGSDPELIQKKIDALQSSLQKFDGDDDLLGLFTGTVKTPPINQKIYKEIERLTNEKLKAENLINRLAEFRKRDRDTRAYRQGSLKGKDFYNHLGGGEAASEYLNSLGIPGIKYLDGMSRAAGQGSRNFVSFTPDHIEMLERNGVPMKGLLD